MQKIKTLLSKVNYRQIVLALYIVLGLTFFYHIIFANRLIPGIKVGGQKIGSQTHSQAVKSLKEFEITADRSISYTFEDRAYTIDANDLGLTYEWEASVNRAFEVGRTGNFLVDTKDKIAGLFKTLYIPAFYELDENLLEQKVSLIVADVNQDANDAHPELVDNTIIIKPSIEGRRVSQDGLYETILNSFDRVEFGVFPLPMVTDHPDFEEGQLIPLIPGIEKIVSQELTVIYGSEKWLLSREELLSFLDFHEKDDGSVDFALNKPKFEALLATIQASVDQLPRGKVTQTNGDVVIGFDVQEPGQEVDVKAFTEDFKEAYFGGLATVDVAIAQVDTLSKEEYGILAKLGEGTSKYVGSASGRIHNLNLAAVRTSGVLVPPGETYSFNKSVGPISGATGYSAAYIISNGRTIIGDGGGVCQTSTTLFRAVLNSGLPVITRFPHDYRVTYYEQDSQLGFDASIYQPTLDFQFKNDTKNYVLVQSEADLENYGLKFTLYGTPDGRKVEISDSVVTNVSGAPAPLYQDDPTLQKGVVKQVDFSAGGATATFTRQVTLGDATLSDDTFTTVYRPWRAIYLVGTKE